MTSGSDRPEPPGERGDRRRLERPPSARYGPAAGDIASGSPTAASGSSALARRGAATALATALVGAMVVMVVYGVVATTVGLLAIAGVTGFLVGLRARGTAASGVAPAIAAASMILGILGGWLISIIQGGVAGPLDYVAQTLGVLALLVPVVAVVGAVLGRR